MASDPQQRGGSPPKPWENTGTSSGPSPFSPPSGGSTSNVVEASGTARPGEIVSSAHRNQEITTNTVARSVPTRPWQQQQTYGNTYGSTYGGYGSGYGYTGYCGGVYANGMYNRGGYGPGGVYGGGMYNGGYVGGYGMGMGPGQGPYGNQDPNNPHGGPPSPPGFWMHFLRVLQGAVNFFGRMAILIDQNTQDFHLLLTTILQLCDRGGVLYGELARFVLRILGIKTKPGKVPGPTGPNGPHNRQGKQNLIEGPKAAPSGAWDKVWGDNSSS